MKTSKIFSLVIACSFFACSNDYVVDQPVKSVEPEASTQDLILEKAAEAYDFFYPASSRAIVNFSDKVIYGVNKKSRVGEPTDTLMYVVNALDDQGFVILGAPLEKDIVLAVSNEGNLANLDYVENPGMQMFLDCAQEYLEELNEENGLEFGPGLQPATYERIINLENTVDIAPRVTVKWGQSYPEGMYCPNTTCGCVVTAAVQALSYFECPDTINLNFPNAPQDSESFNWERMRTKVRSGSWYQYHSVWENQTPTPIVSVLMEDKLGLICRELGFRCNANYNTNPNSTGMSLYSMINTINGLQTGVRITSGIFYNIPVVKNVIGNGLIMMCGSRDGGAHAWLVDGCKYVNREHIVYTLNPNTNQYEVTNDYIEFIDYHHNNWGWNGKCNGYFNSQVYRTNQGQIYDDENLDNSIDMNYDHSFYYCIITPYLSLN